MAALAGGSITWCVLGYGRPRVWRPTTGYLCVGCLENRIGRSLQPNDFTDALINELHLWNTKRLMMRRLGLSDSELRAVRATLRAN